jgi:hypothetical protein
VDREAVNSRTNFPPRPGTGARRSGKNGVRPR